MDRSTSKWNKICNFWRNHEPNQWHTAPYYRWIGREFSNQLQLHLRHRKREIWLGGNLKNMLSNFFFFLHCRSPVECWKLGIPFEPNGRPCLHITAVILSIVEQPSVYLVRARSKTDAFLFWRQRCSFDSRIGSCHLSHRDNFAKY